MQLPIEQMRMQMVFFEACLHEANYWADLLFCTTFASHVKTSELIITSKLTKHCKCAQKCGFKVFTWASKRDETHSIDEL